MPYLLSFQFFTKRRKNFRKEVIHPQLRLGIPCSCCSTHYCWHGLYLHPDLVGSLRVVSTGSTIFRKLRYSQKTQSDSDCQRISIIRLFRQLRHSEYLTIRCSWRTEFSECSETRTCQISRWSEVYLVFLTRLYILLQVLLLLEIILELLLQLFVNEKLIHHLSQLQF